MTDWISVKTELPTTDDPCYIWPPVELSDYHYTASYEIHTTKKWDIEYTIAGDYTDTFHPSPTHWKPIEPPKEVT